MRHENLASFSFTRLLLREEIWQLNLVHTSITPSFSGPTHPYQIPVIFFAVIKLSSTKAVSREGLIPFLFLVVKYVDRDRLSYIFILFKKKIADRYTFNEIVLMKIQLIHCVSYTVELRCFSYFVYCQVLVKFNV